MRRYREKVGVEGRAKRCVFTWPILCIEWTNTREKWGRTPKNHSFLFQKWGRTYQNEGKTPSKWVHPGGVIHTRGSLPWILRRVKGGFGSGQLQYSRCAGHLCAEHKRTPTSTPLRHRILGREDTTTPICAQSTNVRQHPSHLCIMHKNQTSLCLDSTTVKIRPAPNFPAGTSYCQDLQNLRQYREVFYSYCSVVELYSR